MAKNPDDVRDPVTHRSKNQQRAASRRDTKLDRCKRAARNAARRRALKSGTVKKGQDVGHKTGLKNAKTCAQVKALNKRSNTKTQSVQSNRGHGSNKGKKMK